jgi:AraC-like DNA-binding protein
MDPIRSQMTIIRAQASGLPVGTLFQEPYMSKVPFGGRTGAMLELRYLHGGTAVYMPGERFGPRLLRDYELVWIVSGRATYQCNGTDHDAPPGSLILARPGFHETYVWDPQHRTRHAYFHFGIAARPRDWPSPPSWPVVRAPGSIADDVARPLFRHIVEHFCRPTRPGYHRPPRAATRLVEALLALYLAPSAARPAPRARPLPEPVLRALVWVQHTLHHHTPRSLRALALTDLAAAAAVSPKHLCRLFGHALGITPMQAVRGLRLEWSMALLLRSNLSVKQVAARCGFASPYHFSRSFARVYGCPPSEVRRLALQGAAPPPSPWAIDLPPAEPW